jgi:SynChlorMet cassette protein ScmC
MFNLDELLVWKHPHCDDILVAVMAKNNFISRTRVMWKTLDIIFQQTIPAGGFPLHAALIKFKNQGFLILSRGGIGKTTCYRRVRKPWEAICDDEVLVCSRNGKYYVHACPTWGNLVCKMDKQSQNIENPIPLTAILLLKQAKIDKVSPVKSGQTAASLVQRAIQIARRGFEPLPLSKKLKLSRLIFNHACQVAKKIPAYTLAASLTGKFWKKIPLSPARV